MYRKYNNKMASQQCRYMLITIIFIVTIYIYVIYSTNEMQVIGRTHPSPPIIFHGYMADDAMVAAAFIGPEYKTLTNDTTIKLNGGSAGGGSVNDTYVFVAQTGGDTNNSQTTKLNATTTVVAVATSTGAGNNTTTSNQVRLMEKTNSNNSNQMGGAVSSTKSSAKLDNSKLPNSNDNHVKNNSNSNVGISSSGSSSSNSNSNNSVKNNSNNVTVSIPPTPSASLNNNTNSGGPLDTSKGIRTAELYEAGHIESNSDICPELGGPIRLLILITSAPTHREARLAIRQTWGHYTIRRDVAIGFMLGRTENHAIEDQLDAENYMYGDLIRGNFIDSYNNLTLKTISSLEWVNRYCAKASFVLKTDDDMFINVPKLLGFVEKHIKDTKTIYGRLAKKWKPIRNRKSKYYVSVKQYFPAVFPQFTTGPAYLMTSDCIHDLYYNSLNQTYLKLEDVYTTGIVAHLSNIKRVHVNEFLNRRISFNPCYIKKAISVHMIKANEQFDLWKKLQDTTTKCK